MEWKNKYWWWILVILILPFAINFILLIPTFTKIVGDNTTWLSFWGSYLGSIISAGVAFVILHIQRKDTNAQNANNRKESFSI